MAAAEEEQILDNIDPHDSSKLAEAIHLATKRAKMALGEIRTRIEGFDSKYQATERAAALIQPMLDQAAKAFDDLATTATKIQEDVKASVVVEVPVRAISQALAKANMTLEAIVLLAKQYDAKYELSEKLVTLIAPHQERVGAAISDASSYATASAEAATCQLRGVHAAITEKGLSAAAASMVTQLVAAQAASLDERFAIRSNFSELAQRTTDAAQTAQSSALTKVADNVTAIASNSKVVNATIAVRSAVEAVESRYGVTERVAALDNRVTGGKASGWAAAAFSQGMSMASGVLSYATSAPAASNLKNKAFLFIKPHAVTDAAKELVGAQLVEKGFTICSEGSISAEDIDSKQLIDNHYYAIASKATILKPDQLNIPEEKFEAKFGLSWADALAGGRVFNALDACADLEIDAVEMDKQWGIHKKADKLIKFGGGFYCGHITIEGKEPCYVFNGFFMEMRSKYVTPGLSIHYYVVEWDAATMPWTAFRSEGLGATDPAEAPAGAVRAQILAQWEALGLASEPNVGDNGMHGSASPFEAFAELVNWTGADPATEPFGKAMLDAGISAETIKAWSVDPQVTLPGGDAKGSLFDSVEDMDADACLAKLVEVNKANSTAQ